MQRHFLQGGKVAGRPTSAMQNTRVCPPFAASQRLSKALPPRKSSAGTFRAAVDRSVQFGIASSFDGRLFGEHLIDSFEHATSRCLIERATERCLIERRLIERAT